MMGENKITLKTQYLLKEAEQKGWNDALVAARKAVEETGLYYKDGLNALDRLYKKP